MPVGIYLKRGIHAFQSQINHPDNRLPGLLLHLRVSERGWGRLHGPGFLAFGLIGSCNVPGGTSWQYSASGLLGNLVPAMQDVHSRIGQTARKIQG